MVSQLQWLYKRSQQNSVAGNTTNVIQPMVLPSGHWTGVQVEKQVFASSASPEASKEAGAELRLVPGPEGDAG